MEFLLTISILHLIFLISSVAQPEVVEQLDLEVEVLAEVPAQVDLEVQPRGEVPDPRDPRDPRAED